MPSPAAAKWPAAPPDHLALPSAYPSQPHSNDYRHLPDTLGVVYGDAACSPNGKCDHLRVCAQRHCGGSGGGCSGARGRRRRPESSAGKTAQSTRRRRLRQRCRPAPARKLRGISRAGARFSVAAAASRRADAAAAEATAAPLPTAERNAAPQGSFVLWDVNQDMKLPTLPVRRSIHIKTNFISFLQLYNISAHSRSQVQTHAPPTRRDAKDTGMQSTRVSGCKSFRSTTDMIAEKKTKLDPGTSEETAQRAKSAQNGRRVPGTVLPGYTQV
ncbi:uncharacterized protein LOC126263436 [Schistocerca nitens]|uniref:uncharacterized protein LOC126263436 n=1 Tax=Schistocerca nitens TaxID=7011 RepID=UPI00211827EE|nr:uncharacterized protein LOC126263436 [Schistocerca nitens]